MHRSRRFLILVLAFGLLTAACGDDADPDTTAGDDPSSSDATDASDPSTDASDPAVSGPAPSDDDPIPVEPDGGIGDSPFGSVPFFGANDDQCVSPTLTNSADDGDLLSAAIDCFFAEYDADTPVVLDVSVPTVEGDPIYHRYLYDGEGVTIVIDNRADTFGSGAVIAERCETLAAGDFLPVGGNCVDINDHPGFPEAEG